MNITNKRGITTLFIFSIPFETPILTINNVITTAAKCHNIDPLLKANELKYPSVLILPSCPVMLITKYFKIHPITIV